MRDNNIRGKILEFLKYIYPEGADERSVVSVFYEYHRHQDILHALEYLTDKGYAFRKELTHPYKKQEKVRMYKISPQGIDLLDGIVSDPGITVAPEEE